MVRLLHGITQGKGKIHVILSCRLPVLITQDELIGTASPAEFLADLAHPSLAFI